MSEKEAGLRLTFGQIAWFITVMGTVLSMWGDLRVQLARMEASQQDIAHRVEQLERRMDAVRRQLNDP